MLIDEKSPIPKYFQLQIWLKEQIEQGIFHPEDKIPTEEQLCKQLCLSRATIKHAIQNLVDKGYLIRKRKLGTFVAKPFLHNGSNCRIGMLLNYYKSGFGIELIRGACDKAAEYDYQLVLSNSFDLHVQADYHADRLIEQNVRGVIYVPTAADDENNRSIVNKFLRNHIPVVLLDRDISHLDTDKVVTDNFEGAYTLINYIIAKGHKKIAIVVNTLLNTARDRLAGYRQALMDAGLPIRPELIFTSNEHSSEENYEEIARMVLSHRKNYTAIFAENDKMAYTIASICQKMGIRIPQDLSLAGYDDIPSTNHYDLALTTVHQPLYEMGMESLELMKKRIAGDISERKTIRLRCYLVERESVLALQS